MSDLQIICNSPIGALFFVSGSISVFVLLAIFIIKKGNDLHSILGYLFFFCLCFTNYSAAISYYEGYLPLAAVSVTVPVSMLSIILSLGSIISSSKSLLRIRIHVVFSCISAVSIIQGAIINWYHFNISPLDIFRWTDFNYLLMISIPVIMIGTIFGFYFMLKSSLYFKAIQKSRNIDSPTEHNFETDIVVDTRNQTILRDKSYKPQQKSQFSTEA